ncbi:hypothetical protein AB0910_02990 [Streptomyces sp. NPDC047002]|uniref:hypothetical protein n=1 Tax=Streptomyces sp. NPDC047002 TaxID=3155475 RepID=UPI0034547ACB
MTPPSEPPAAAPSLQDGGRPPEDRRHRNRRRFLTLVVIVLLVGVPAGYLAIAAEQSRDSGRKSEAEAAATGLQPIRPAGFRKRIYDLPIPAGATKVRYYETNNWKNSRLYTQFDVTSGRLDTFLDQMGTDRSALRPGAVTISARDQKIATWDFSVPDHLWAGLVLKQKQPLPTVDVVVDLSDPAVPRVYAVSTAKP